MVVVVKDVKLESAVPLVAVMDVVVTQVIVARVIKFILLTI
tara:strand:- start:116 stop:238 length:123 start_codon:yes stop_codon:yes gene_type:complete